MDKFLLVCCRNGKFDTPLFFEEESEAVAKMQGDYSVTMEGYISEDSNQEFGGSNLTDFDAFIEADECQCYWRIFDITESEELLMASSRIIQLRSEQLSYAIYEGEDDCMITVDDIKENRRFVGPIADYISGGSDRIKDFQWLVKVLQNRLGDGHEKFLSYRCNDDKSEMPDAHIIFKSGFKKAYFQSIYTAFIEKVAFMSLESFMDRLYASQLEDAIRGKFSFYIADDASNLMPLDTFVRYLPDDADMKYWLWGTAKYHF